MFNEKHDENDRTYTDKLIGSSEQVFSKDLKDKVTSITNDWGEATVGWKPIVPYPKVVSISQGNNVTVKKRRTVERSVTDLQSYGSRNLPDVGIPDFLFTYSESKSSVKCVGDDFENLPLPAWKDIVEQGTFRYIPNNGSYRTRKFLWDERKDWYTVRKKYPEKIATALQQNYKRIHRELKRQLKKELEATKEVIKPPDSARGQSEPSSGEDTSVSEKDPKDVSEAKSERLLYRKEPRIKSTRSEGSNTKGSQMQTIPEYSSASELQTNTNPLPEAHLIKSASDLFIESISTRLTALDEEMRRDSKWIRKSQDESKTGKPKYRDITNGNTPRGQTNIYEPVSQDTFSIKPVNNKKSELKPIEKAKQFKYTPHGAADFSQNSSCEASELEKTLTSYKNAIESTKQSLFNTLTGTKIQTYGSKRASSRGLSMPSTITLCDTTNGERKAFDNYPAAPPNQIAIDKKKELQQLKGPLPGILPEISGKRMEVATITHRML